MKAIEMIAPFKGLKPGQIVTREDELADWLCSRKYAVPATLVDEPSAGDAFEAVPEKKKTFGSRVKK